MFDQTVRGIHVKESEQPPELVDMAATGEFLFCTKFAKQFLLRRVVCEKLVAAQKRLPDGYRFMLFEAFRPRARQIELWNGVMAQLKREHPNRDDEQYRLEAEKFVANPHGFGSGHQAGAAVDISLADASGQEIFFGTQVQEFNEKTQTRNARLSPEEAHLRVVLKTALESEGVINYPDEWWHFSYGDRLWAEVTQRNAAFFAPID